MRILYFINQIENSGGIERIVIDKVNYLAQLPNYEIHLLYYENVGSKSFFSIGDNVRLWAIESKRTHSLIKKQTSLIHIYHKTLKLIDDISPDIIINANAKISYFLPILYKRIPKIAELHFTYEGLHIMNEELYGKNRLKSYANSLLRRFFYAQFDKCVVLVTDDLKAWGFTNMTVIPNFTNMICKPVSTDREKVVINVGRLEDQKDHQMLIEAWKMVNEKYPDWKLEIWGSGSLKDALQRQIVQLGLNDSVFLRGVTQNVGPEYQRASLFALSSKYEGMPLVAIEAMTAGVPCVSFDISGVRDVISDGEDGVIVKQHTTQALADGIIQLIDNEELRIDMSKKSILKVRRFGKETVMQKWIELFESI